MNLKYDNVNLTLYPLTYPDRYFCPHNKLLDISSLSNALNSTAILLLFFYGDPTPLGVGSPPPNSRRFDEIEFLLQDETTEPTPNPQT
jgi:hypothetical protein